MIIRWIAIDGYKPTSLSMVATHFVIGISKDAKIQISQMAG